MCSEIRAKQRRHRLACGALFWLAACTFSSAPSHPRPATPANATFAPPLPPIAALACHDDGGEVTGTLAAGDERVQFRWRRHDANEPRPLVLLVPILAGGEGLLDQVGSRLLDRGFDVASCARVGPALRGPQRGRELDQLFARTITHQRILLHWLRTSPQPPPQTFVLGMSLGGMVATVLTAHDPQIAGAAICLSGGGLADLVVCSSESRVQSWRRFRHETDGVGDDHLRWELDNLLRHEPLRHAGAIAAERLLMVNGRYDTVVPTVHQDLLWEALGRPDRMVVPLGHYSAALVVEPILDAAARHFHRFTAGS
jgi:dienelactone hydrolase